jgi:anti-anti-sigma regulatory factor
MTVLGSLLSACGSAMLVAAFLILLAASAAVAGSIIVLGLFDVIFVKKKPQDEALRGELEASDADPSPRGNAGPLSI